jgi:hypothetical protein
VRKWMFSPLYGRQGSKYGVAYVGKLTYYFIKNCGRYRVVAPDQEFYVGPGFCGDGGR